MNNTIAHPVRKWPRHIIAARLKAHGIRQWDIARRLRCSQSQVSKVIARQNLSQTKMTEAIWRYLERVFTTEQAA